MKACKVCGRQYNVLYKGYCKRCFQTHKMQTITEIEEDESLRPPENMDNTIKAMIMSQRMSEEYRKKKFSKGR